MKAWRDREEAPQTCSSGLLQADCWGSISHLALLQTCVPSEDSENIWASVQFQSACGQRGRRRFLRLFQFQFQFSSVFSEPSPAETRTVPRFLFQGCPADAVKRRFSSLPSVFCLLPAEGKQRWQRSGRVICRAVALIHPALMHSLPPTPGVSDARPLNRAGVCA